MIEVIDLTRAKKVLAGFLQLEIEIIDTALLSLQEEKPYRVIMIPKKSGDKRIVYCSKSKELKIVQRAILENILYKFELDDNFFGFCPNKNIVQNARYHVRDIKEYNPYLPTWIMKIDILDAFPSINTSMLAVLFTDIFSEAKLDSGCLISKQEWYVGFLHLLLQFTTYNGVMIQGISTSPYLFNLYIATTINQGIKDLFDRGTIIRSEEYGWYIYPFKFSWYADDLVISFNKMIPGFKKKIIGIIEYHGLSVNKSKIRLTRVNRSHPLITGVVINIAKYPTPYSCDYESEFGTMFGGVYRNNTVTTRPTSKTIKSIRGKIHRAISIINSGRLPEKEKDGMSIGSIFGYINYIRYLSRINNKKGGGFMIPSSLKKIIQEFQFLVKERGIK